MGSKDYAKKRKKKEKKKKHISFLLMQVQGGLGQGMDQWLHQLIKAQHLHTSINHLANSNFPTHLMGMPPKKKNAHFLKISKNKIKKVSISISI